MKRKLKKELKKLYQPPKPLRKQAFLAELPKPRISNWDFLWSQVGYIRKWNWMVSAVVFICGLCVGTDKGKQFTSVLAAMIPVLALSFVAEGSRSVRYGMAELEMASKFSMKAVLMAKFTILGIENAVLLAVLFPLLMRNENYGLLSAALMILFPYLLSCFCNLAIVRKIHGKESIYFCSTVCILISMCVSGIIYSKINIYSLMEPAGWGLSLVILAVLTIREGKRILHQSEELVWSLS